jgi:hypothetical protein
MRSVHLLDSVNLDSFCGAVPEEDKGWSWTISLAETSCMTCRRRVASDNDKLRRWNAQTVPRVHTAPRPPAAAALRVSGRHLQLSGWIIATAELAAALAISAGAAILNAAAVLGARAVSLFELTVRALTSAFLLGVVALNGAAYAMDRRRRMAYAAGRVVIASQLDASRRL